MRITIGPFRTVHHQMATAGTFADTLKKWVLAEVVPRLGAGQHDIVGTFSTPYDDEKYFGARSAVKHRYELALDCTHASGTDEVHALLDYDAGTQTFTLAGGKALRIVTAAQKCERRVQLEAMLQMVARYGKGEDALPCPNCGQALLIYPRPGTRRVKDISCRSCNDVHLHFDP